MARGWWRRRLFSFECAFRGIAICLRTQMNAQLHLGAAVVVAVLGFGLQISPGEWAALVLAIALVWTAEALNTALEFTIDLVSPEWQPLAGRVKDVAAGAVLIASLAVLVIGALIFGPRLWEKVG